jgi:hypothetical protein
VSRFAWAQSQGLISAAEFAAVTGAAGSLAPATVIYDTIQGRAMSGDRRVLGPFQTAPQALPALRPADRSFLGPESRLGQTALTSGCPDCAEAAPEGCADHREDAARAAGYQRALRSLATGRKAQLRTPARPAASRVGCRSGSWLLAWPDGLQARDVGRRVADVSERVAAAHRGLDRAERIVGVRARVAGDPVSPLPMLNPPPPANWSPWIVLSCAPLMSSSPPCRSV